MKEFNFNVTDYLQGKKFKLELPKTSEFIVNFTLFAYKLSFKIRIAEFEKTNVFSIEKI